MGLSIEQKWAYAQELCEEFFGFDPNPQNAEFEVQDAAGIVQTSTSGPRDAAFAEALRNASQYAQDGPVWVFEVFRVQVFPS